MNTKHTKHTQRVFFDSSESNLFNPAVNPKPFVLSLSKDAQCVLIYNSFQFIR